MASPLLVTAAMIIYDDQILLTRNNGSPYGPDYWGFPAGIGGFKKYSDPALAVIEEVRGDIGCEFNGTFYIQHHFEPPRRPPTVTMFYVGTIEGVPNPVCKNVLEAKFFPLEEAKDLQLKYDHNHALDELLNQYDSKTT